MTRVVERRRGRRDERGMVLVYFALSLTMLLAMAAFSVDVGSWYQRSERIQKAADAAALAGVVWMPDNYNQAVAAATATAAANGFTDGANGGSIHVTVAAVPNQPKQLAVTIKDDKVAQYFSKAFVSNIHEQRSATAEYAKSVPMGSPENSLGTGPSCGSGANATCLNDAGFWLSINGYCTAKEDGDLRASRFGGNRAGPPLGLTACPTGAPVSPQFLNTDYDPKGYTYDVEVPANGFGKALYSYPIQIFDAAFKVSSTAGDAGSCSNTPCPAGETPHITTDWSITNPSGATVASGTFGDNDTNNIVNGFPSAVTYDDGAWHALYTTQASVSPAGTYQFHIATRAGEANSWGKNNFGLRVDKDGSGRFTPCTTVGGTVCPEIHGADAISIQAQPASGTTSFEFYLAQVTTAQDGSNMTISLFDPGEGMSQIQVEKPTSSGWTPTSFTYSVLETDDHVAGANFPTPTTGITDVGSTVPLLPGRASNYKYNDREVVITAQIPPGSGANQGGWFKLKYTSSGVTVSDRTTWAVKVGGDPVHLVG